MIKLTTTTQKLYEEFTKVHFVNGQFVFDEEINQTPSDQVLSYIKQLRANNYSYTEAAKKIYEEFFIYLDGKSQIPFLFVDYDKGQLSLALEQIAAALFVAYADVLDYQLDEETEQKYLWRY